MSGTTFGGLTTTVEFMDTVDIMDTFQGIL